MVDGYAELYLPAVAVHRGSVFLRTGTGGFGARIVFFKHLKSVCLTYLITQLTKLSEEKLIVVKLDTTFKIVCTYNQVVVYMLPIYMRGDQYLTVSKTTGKLHADLVRFLRCDVLTYLEGLHVVVKTNAVGLVREHLLSGEEGLVCHFGNAVVTRHVCKLLVLVNRF